NEKEDLETSRGKNLFIDLEEKISQELNVTNCWICGNTQMAKVWPWEGISLRPIDILKWTQTRKKVPAIGQRGKEWWELKSKIIGEE
ncbi:ENR1 protein, partial [Oreotrochilus melanogaster]|nr:ENR1 protein [Oreotrochilus melanogaster]